MSSAEECKHCKPKSLEHLRALTFPLADYAPPSIDWDYDHGEGCWAKFAVFDALEILHSGYFTTVELADETTEESEMINHSRESGRTVLAKPDTKKWACPECFETFRTTVSWKLISDP